MSGKIRIGLVIAFIVFLGAIIWVVVATRGHKKVETKTTDTTNTSTLVGTPVTSTAPVAVTPTAPTPTPAATATPTATAKKPVVRYQTIITEETIEESSSSAWASAGTNADGSTWAEAHAE